MLVMCLAKVKPKKTLQKHQAKKITVHLSNDNGNTFAML